MQGTNFACNVGSQAGVYSSTENIPNEQSVIFLDKHWLTTKIEQEIEEKAAKKMQAMTNTLLRVDNLERSQRMLNDQLQTAREDFWKALLFTNGLVLIIGTYFLFRK